MEQVLLSLRKEKYIHFETIVKALFAGLLFFMFHFSYGQLDFKARIDSLITAKTQKKFNGIILITQHGKVKYSSTTGFSDLEAGVSLTMQDQFVIGSISKQFTAVLILQEVDKGKVDLLLPIHTYLPELNQSWADTVTVHHLLTHTHGINKVDEPAIFKAGTQYSYSQIGYDLLAKIVERVSKKTFARRSQELFNKCKMTHTFHPDIHKYTLVKGYTEQSNGVLAFDSASLENYVAAGGFISTANDLNIWNQQLHSGKLLKKSTYERMISKQHNAVRQHPIFGLTEYGYGLTVNNSNEVLQLGQTGFAPGFVSMNFYYPESQTTVIVLGNIAYDVNNLKQTFYHHRHILKIINENSGKETPYVSNDEHLSKTMLTGADQVNEYLPLLKNKRVGMLINQTSIIGDRSLLDSLVVLGVNIKMVFGPEHGFRSNASNGAHVANEVDEKTGIPIISLYGKKRKPSKAEMDSVDVIVFDIQDVGCRFYTYINKLYDIMEACAEFDKELIILDRPNPNGYVDGPVLDMNLKSGIGKFPIPIVHGMTIGEFAKMINGEGWLPNGKQCEIKVIPMKNYFHAMDYTLPVQASPNLNTNQSVLLYPSLCLFEGTAISQGRGTYMPFTVLGSPDLKGKFEFNFKPKSIPGMSETPLYQEQVCYGIDLRTYDTRTLHDSLNLSWLIEMYRVYPFKELFFDSSKSAQIGDFNKLAGTTELKQQIIMGISEKEIRRSWEPKLSAYKEMRMKYLLYP